jgi:hypothetical protein
MAEKRPTSMKAASLSIDHSNDDNETLLQGRSSSSTASSLNHFGSLELLFFQSSLIIEFLRKLLFIVLP